MGTIELRNKLFVMIRGCNTMDQLKVVKRYIELCEPYLDEDIIETAKAYRRQRNMTVAFFYQGSLEDIWEKTIQKINLVKLTKDEI